MARYRSARDTARSVLNRSGVCANNWPIRFRHFQLPAAALPLTIESLPDLNALKAAEEEIATGIIDGTNVLVMDMDLCIRCGNCSLACHKMHGQSRLLRRGIQIERPVSDRQEAFATCVSSAGLHALRRSGMYDGLSDRLNLSRSARPHRHRSSHVYRLLRLRHAMSLRRDHDGSARSASGKDSSFVSKLKSAFSI